MISKQKIQLQIQDLALLRDLQDMLILQGSKSVPILYKNNSYNEQFLSFEIDFVEQNHVCIFWTKNKTYVEDLLRYWKCLHQI